MPNRRPTSSGHRSHRPARGPSAPRPNREPIPIEERVAPGESTQRAASPTAPIVRTTPAPRVWRPVNRTNARPLIRPLGPSGPTIITDYAYVMTDLRRIGILAAVAFVVLLALSFVIR